MTHFINWPNIQRSWICVKRNALIISPFHFPLIVSTKRVTGSTHTLISHTHEHYYTIFLTKPKFCYNSSRCVTWISDITYKISRNRQLFYSCILLQHRNFAVKFALGDHYRLFQSTLLRRIRFCPVAGPIEVCNQSSDKKTREREQIKFRPKTRHVTSKLIRD